MYVIENESQLIGKAIKNTYLSGYRDFDDYICILTDDDGLYVNQIDYIDDTEHDRSRIYFRTLTTPRIQYLIAHSCHFKDILSCYLGITEEEINEFAKDEIDKQNKKRLAQQKEDARKKYESAKAYIEKFEKDDVEFTSANSGYILYKDKGKAVCGNNN